MEVDRRNKPSIGKRFPCFGFPVNGKESKAKNSRFRPNRNLTGTIYHWSLILRSLSVVSSSAKRDANGFFKVLLLSLHLLISRHPVRKSKFGACAVTGYCSFKVKQGHLETAIFILHNFYVFMRLKVFRSITLKYLNDSSSEYSDAAVDGSLF